MIGSCPMGAVLVALGLGACVERPPTADRDQERAAAVLESGRAPIAVTARQELAADGRVVRELLVKAEPGSERWFERARGELRLELGVRRVGLTTRPDGLGARWDGGPGVLSWSAPDGSAGLRVELADLHGEVERPPQFVPVRPTGHVGFAVPVGVGP